MFDCIPMQRAIRDLYFHPNKGAIICSGSDRSSGNLRLNQLQPWDWWLIPVIGVLGGSTIMFTLALDHNFQSEVDLLEYLLDSLLSGTEACFCFTDLCACGVKIEQIYNLFHKRGCTPQSARFGS